MSGYLEFREAIGKRESNGNYRAVNQFGYVGKYQFGKPRLYDLGISLDGWHPKGRPVKRVFSTDYFLMNRDLQDTTFFLHVSQLKNIVLNRYNKFLGIRINDVLITLSGCIAGIHLKGQGVAEKDVPNSKQGLRHFLYWGIDAWDGNKVKISSYIKMFGGYDLDEVEKTYIHKNNLDVFRDFPNKPLDLIPK